MEIPVFAVELLQGGAVLIAIAIAVQTFIRAIYALKAQNHFRERIRITLKNDTTFTEMRLRIIDDSISSAQLAELRDILDRLAKELPDAEYRAVKNTLHQSSKAGEKRFVASLLNAA